MQAIKDAGILLVLVILIATVRITPIEAADGADPSLLAPPAEAATSAPAALAGIALEATPDEIVERCAQFVFELKEDQGHPAQYVVVVETEEEDGKAAPCPRT